MLLEKVASRELLLLLDWGTLVALDLLGLGRLAAGENAGAVAVLVRRVELRVVGGVRKGVVLDGAKPCRVFALCAGLTSQRLGDGLERRELL